MMSFLPVVACAVVGIYHASAAPELMKNDVNPVGKVVELLDVLQKQLYEDGIADGSVYSEVTALHQNVTTDAKRVIQETSGALASLDSGIEEQKTVVVSLTRRLETSSGELTNHEADLKEASGRRTKERTSFEESETTLVQAVDQLERALDVLGTTMPATPPAQTVNLASVARRLRTVFTQGVGDIQLTGSQRKTLDAFFRAAAANDADDASTWRRSLRVTRSSATAFLQVDGSSASEGVDATLRSALATSEKELNEAREAEKSSQQSFAGVQVDLERHIANKEKTVSEIKTQIAQAQQMTSQMEAKEMEAKVLLKSSEAELAACEEEYQRKTRGFKNRVEKRSDEILAVREATQIITSEAAQRVLQAQDEEEQETSNATSFLQVAQRPNAKRIAVHLLRKATAPGVALLALRTHTASSRSRGKADPFAKVKSMIRDMLQKLQDEHSKEAERKAWCDSEMGKSTKQKESKEAMLEKLSDRVNAMEVEIAELTKDLEMTTRDLANMEKSTIAATDIRKKERDHATVAIQQYTDAVELIGTAIKVLKNFYAAKGKGTQMVQTAQSPQSDESYKPKAGLGKGIIGIMEIAQQDFADLLQETEGAENAAEQEYKELMSETQVRTAVFRKDLEYKEREKVKLEGDRMHTSRDKKGFEQELETVNVYLGQLSSSCIGKAESYGERKARREEELAALKEAQEYLTNAA